MQRYPTRSNMMRAKPSQSKLSMSQDLVGSSALNFMDSYADTRKDVIKRKKIF